MDDGFIGGNKKLLIEMVLCSMVIYIIIAIIDIIKEKKRIDISARLQYSLSDKAFSHLIKMKAGYFSDKNNAGILNNINIDIENITSIADEGVFFVVTKAFSIVGGVIGLFMLNYYMTILVLIFIPIKCTIMKYFAKQRKRIVDELIIDKQDYSGWFGDTVEGIKEVKIFGIYDNKHKEFSKRQNKVLQDQKKINMLDQYNIISDTILVHLITTLIYIVGINLVLDFQLSVGSVFSFITYSVYVTEPISAILNIGYLLSGIIPSTKRFYEFINMEEEDQGKTIKSLVGDIEFQQVSFAYEKDKQVLKNINIVFARESKTALIGKNGSGKSTIIDLILRMYDPTEGKIMLAGIKIADIPLESYRSMISIVSQDIYLFNDSIRNNICLYRQVDDSMILDVCKNTGLSDFIAEVSFDYLVGHNGVMLSGGQKQKIALARALIQDRPIVIFDEATSAADAYSEQQINTLLHTELSNKTVIVITHKCEILREMDQIAVLNNGKIDIVGRYEEIKSSSYWNELLSNI